MLCCFAAEITFIYFVCATLLMNNFNDFMTLFGTLELEWLCHASVWISPWWLMHLNIVVEVMVIWLWFKYWSKCKLWCVWVVICCIIVAFLVPLYWPKGCWNENDIKDDLGVLYAYVWNFLFYSPFFKGWTNSWLGECLNYCLCMLELI